MIDDLQNLRILDTVHSLRLLIVIHQNDALLLRAQQFSAGNHTKKLSILINNREITMTVLRHNILDIIDKIIAAEGDQIRFLHKEIDRNTLIDQSGSRESVMGRRDDRAAMLLGLNGDCTGDRYVAGNNDAAGIPSQSHTVEIHSGFR